VLGGGLVGGNGNQGVLERVVVGGKGRRRLGLRGVGALRERMGGERPAGISGQGLVGRG
jgi:hypothetical protein